MHVQVDLKTLARAGASPVLALDPGVFATGLQLTGNAEDQEPSELEEKVAIVAVRGPLAQRARVDLCAYVDGYDAISRRLQKALASDAKSVLLAIDSPGGDVAGLEQAVAGMRAAVEAAGKPVVAYVDELAASAAYWIAACVADVIVVPPSGRVGSIGCIGAIVDETKALEKEGVKVSLVREPAGKADGHPCGPIIELAEARVGTMVRAAAGRFYEAVGARRKIKSEAVAALNGEVFEGSAALSKGLVDEVGGLSSAMARAQRLARGTRMEKLREAVVKATNLDAEASEDVLVGAIAALGVRAAKADELEAAEKARQAAEQKAAAEAKAAAERAAQQAALARKAELIEQLKAERKLVGAMVEWAHNQSLETVESFAKSASPAGPAEIKDAPTGQAAIDPELVEALKRQGISVEEYHRLQAQMKAQKEGR